MATITRAGAAAQQIADALVTEYTLDGKCVFGDLPVVITDRDQARAMHGADGLIIWESAPFEWAIELGGPVAPGVFAEPIMGCVLGFYDDPHVKGSDVSPLKTQLDGFAYAVRQEIGC